jgi:hypothetical protein
MLKNVTFLELISGGAALLILLTIGYLAVVGQPIPEILQSLAIGTTSFLFGAKANHVVIDR